MQNDNEEQEVKKAVQNYIYTMIFGIAFIVSTIVTFIDAFFKDYSEWSIYPIAIIVALEIIKVLHTAAWSHFLAKIQKHEVSGSHSYDKEEHNKTKEVELLVVDAPPNPIGFFKDAAIYEWLDFELGEGVIQRFSFFGTCDYEGRNEQSLPKSYVVIPPGIVYQREES